MRRRNKNDLNYNGEYVNEGDGGGGLLRDRYELMQLGEKNLNKREKLTTRGDGKEEIRACSEKTAFGSGG